MATGVLTARQRRPWIRPTIWVLASSLVGAFAPRVVVLARARSRPPNAEAVAVRP